MIVKKYVFLLIALILICLTLPSCNTNDNKTDVFTIETSICNLKYPSKWKDAISIDKLENSTETVRFSLNGTSVFDISFNEGDTLLGKLKKDEKTIDVYVLLYEIDKQNKDYETCLAMQDDVNVITDNLSKDYDFSIGKSLPEDDGKTFEITTPVVTFSYPEKWKNKVDVNLNEETVEFTSDGNKLFNIYFGGSKGNLLGTYDGKEIRLETFAIDSNLPEDKKAEYSSMQEDVNVMLEKLYKDEKFVLAVPVK